jgi:hypothetical protein
MKGEIIMDIDRTEKTPPLSRLDRDTHWREEREKGVLLCGVVCCAARNMSCEKKERRRDRKEPSSLCLWSTDNKPRGSLRAHDPDVLTVFLCFCLNFQLHSRAIEAKSCGLIKVGAG